MQKINILIAEDEPLIAEHLRSIVQKMGYEASLALNLAEIQRALQSASYNVVLLDINLEGKFEGIKIGQHITATIGIPFIFITAHSDKNTLQSAALAEPFSYIVKPFRPVDIQSALELALISKENKSRKQVVINEKDLLVKINTSEIIYIKTDNVYLEIYTSIKRYVQRTSLEKFMELLPPGMFIKTHRSWAVNVKDIKAINSTYLLMKDNTRIPVSRKYKENVLDKFSQP